MKVVLVLIVVTVCFFSCTKGQTSDVTNSTCPPEPTCPPVEACVCPPVTECPLLREAKQNVQVAHAHKNVLIAQTVIDLDLVKEVDLIHMVIGLGQMNG